MTYMNLQNIRIYPIYLKFSTFRPIMTTMFWVSRDDYLSLADDTSVFARFDLQTRNKRDVAWTARQTCRTACLPVAVSFLNMFM